MIIDKYNDNQYLILHTSRKQDAEQMLTTTTCYLHPDSTS
jgi:hypothetical protein